MSGELGYGAFSNAQIFMGTCSFFSLLQGGPLLALGGGGATALLLCSQAKFHDGMCLPTKMRGIFTSLPPERFLSCKCEKKH